MTQTDLSQWTDAGFSQQKSPEPTQADYKVENLLGKYILLEGLKVSDIGKFKGCVFNIKTEPTAQTQTLYSASKVLNEQLLKLIEESKTPCVIVPLKVKNYYTI